MKNIKMKYNIKHCDLKMDFATIKVEITKG